MKKYGLALAISFFLLLFPAASMVFAQGTTDLPGLKSEEGSLYGYILYNLNFTKEDLGNVFYFRLKGDWNPGPNLFFHMELNNDYRTGNQHPAYLTTLLSGATGESLTNASDQLKLQIDHLWGMVNLGRMDVQFGKIPVGWGTGYVFNPTAKTHPGSFLDDFSEETPGTLGLLSSYAFNDHTAFQVYLAFEDKMRTWQPEAGEWDRIPFGIKVQKIRGAFDFSFSWIKEVLYRPETQNYHQEYYLGGDFAGAVGNIGVYGEAALNVPRNEEGKFSFSGHQAKDLLEYCLGGDYLFADADLTLRMEYYHQGRGVTKKTDYNLIKGLSTGQLLQAEDYLLVALEKNFLDYYTFIFGSLINANDGSFILQPELSYNAADNLEVVLASVVPCGEKGSEFNGTWEVGGAKIELIRPSISIQAKLSF
ncbi:MAG: hypothetical protein GX081_10370 [Firmicutes bacterium]|nr:hypothetical protein [Bacillota bacterium]